VPSHAARARRGVPPSFRRLVAIPESTLFHRGRLIPVTGNTFADGALKMFGIGHTELIVIAIVVLVLFGSRLPTVMRSLGRSVVEFKKGVREIDDDTAEK